MRTTTAATVGDGRPATLSDRLARAAARIHAGEQPTGFTVDVMIEAAELLKALTDPDRAAADGLGLRTRMEVQA
jgi:hypothetical protein